MFGLFFCYALLSELSSFAIFLARKRAGYFAFVAPWCLVTDCLCPMALPHGAVGWSAVCACGIY